MGKRTNTAQWLENQQRWQIKVQKDGVRRTFTSSTKGRAGQREANAKADAWLDDGIIDGVRLKALYEKYVESLKLTSSFDNWSKTQSIGKTHILPHIGHMKLSNVTEQNLQDVINIAASKKLAQKTLKNIKGCLSGFLKFARRSKATALTTEAVTIPASAPVGARNILQPNDLVVLFSSDITTFRTKLQRDPLINAYRLQVLTGLRPGELLGLEWRDVKENSIQIRRSINKQGEETKGKNKNAVRTVALSKLAQEVLRAQREKSGTPGKVFDIPSQDVYRERWNNYKTCNGLSDVTPYEMRHTFVSIVKSLPEGEVKAIVGHSRNMDTWGTYSHTVNGDLEKTSNDLTEIFEKLVKNNAVG